MNTKVQQIAEQVKALPEVEREQFFAWLSDFQLQQSDDWDRQISRDSLPGGRLCGVLERVNRDISEGKTKPIDEVINDS